MIRIVLSIVFSAFITFQCISYYFGSSLIDYKFMEHVNLTDAWSLRGFYMTEIILGSIAFVAGAFVLFALSRMLGRIKLSAWVAGGLVLLACVGLAVPGGAFNNLYYVYKVKNAEEKTFDTALEDLSIDTNAYVKPEAVTATAGKNIIVLSLESLERGFLEPPFTSLTPTLQKLAKENTYFKMWQTPGSGWTEASIYTSITGVPAFFRSPKGEIFQNTQINDITSIGHVLEAAGYDMDYYLAKKEFAGLDKMLTHFGFEVYSEKDLGLPSAKNFWGMHDKDLFEAVKQQLLKKKTQEEPFAVFMNTISGHFPNGVYDARMEGVIPPRKSDLEFMVSAVDYYINDFFEFLEKEGFLENTVVYIYPDHMFMGSASQAVNSFSKQRGLYVISTAPEANFSHPVEQPLFQIDLPRILLDGADIKTNAAFIADFVEPSKKKKYIRSNVTNFLSLNEPKVLDYDYSNSIQLELLPHYTPGMHGLNITQEDGFSNTINDLKEGTLYRIFFDPDMNYISYKDIPDDKPLWRGESASIVFSIENDRLYGYLSKGKNIGVAKSGEGSVLFTEEDIDIFEDWELANPKKLDEDQINVKSVGYDALKTRGPSYIKTRKEDHVLGRGLNLLTIRDSVFSVQTFDTWEREEDTKTFVDTLSKILKAKQKFIIVANDEASRNLSNYRDTIAALGLPLLSELDKREAYVGYLNQDGYVLEEKDDKSVSIEYRGWWMSLPRKISMKNERSRFIAHAGGRVNGKVYTNSLKALNHNYRKGFRYFEIDILETSDGALVAGHDWESWKKRTGFNGSLPPTKRQYDQYVRMEQFAPMDMRILNDWFKKHPDAILVTDKINNPKKMASNFIDKDRLMLEVFSWEAFREAKALQLRGVLLSGNVFNSIKGDKRKKLREEQVKYLALPRKAVLANKSLFHQLKKDGIRTYVFHVNYEEGKDERYVYEYELGLVHGMYADTWEFPDMQPTEEKAE
ncbi:sulfatase-like hydrolase/transferase [Flavobacteriaceae bacterium TK19130]|nr:sulfatase-like hydrolase/transferase [Thermobacterium salinum]